MPTIFLAAREIKNESASQIVFANNLAKDLTTALVDPARGDLHITDRATDVIDKAKPMPDVTTDIDGQPRGSRPDIGADEFVP